MRRRAGRIGWALFIVTVLNVFAPFWHIDQIGGCPGNGKQEGERYFVGRTGRYTEVSGTSWRWARVHEVAFWVSLPLAIVVVPLLIAYSGFGGRRQAGPNAADVT